MTDSRASRLEPSAPSYTEAEKHDAFEWLRLYALSNERGARHAAIALFTWGAEKSKTTELRDVLSELVRCMEGKPNRTHPFELVNAKAALTAPEAVPAPLSESARMQTTVEVFRAGDGRVFANVNRNSRQLAHLKAGESYIIDTPAER